jgi:hypothetical protein
VTIVSVPPALSPPRMSAFTSRPSAGGLEATHRAAAVVGGFGVAFEGFGAVLEAGEFLLPAAEGGGGLEKGGVGVLEVVAE